MVHRNYVYDCERLYRQAEKDNILDDSIRSLYRQFLRVKSSLEQSSELRDQGEHHFRMGLPQGWFEADSARRACNRYETELESLARRITEAIRKTRNKTTK